MPLYEYECQIHGITEHLVRHVFDIPLTCPDKSCPLPIYKVLSVSSIKVSGVYSYSLERPSDIRLRERNQTLKVKNQ